ncbi:MAG: hypothetical protein Q7T03_05145 [Deltaproteobacteria bacterium]|nr:hypothetical protein [Deltaproteobacteria bacterium]
MADFPYLLRVPLRSLNLPFLAGPEISTIARSSGTEDLDAGEEARAAAAILKKMGASVPEPLQKLLMAPGASVHPEKIFLENPTHQKVYEYSISQRGLMRKDMETDLESAFATDFWTTYMRKDWTMTEIASDGEGIYILLESPDQKTRVIGKLEGSTIQFDRCWFPVMDPNGFILLGAEFFVYGDHISQQSAMMTLKNKKTGELLCPY